ncbi:MAG TPA: sugar transferase [Acidimicrobiales bacterium]|nr:sugar transferase [Acidimicrobiales bacterium]
MEAIDARTTTELLPPLVTVEGLPASTRTRRRSWATSRQVARLAVMVADVVSVALAMVLAHQGARALHAVSDVRPYLIVGAASLLGWVIVFDRYHLYNARHVAHRRDEVVALVHAIGVSILLTAVVAYALGSAVARSWLVLTFVIASLGLIVERELVRASFNAARRRGHLLRPVALAGTGDEAAALAAMLTDQPELGYRVVALIGDADNLHPSLVGLAPMLDPRTKVAEQVRMAGAAGVLVATTDVDLDTTNRLSRTLPDAGIHVELSSSLKDIDAARLSIRPLGRFPVVYVEPVHRTGWRPKAKRAFDVSLAVALLVVTAPLWLVVAVALKLTSRGPVLFKQERVGRRGRRFQVYKFRTMVVDAEQRLVELARVNEADGPLFKLKQDPRVTQVGRVLRKLSLDELPQLLNVVKGEMSLVGPRPALPREVTQWGPELFDRLRVQPGITGMWQVNGRSNSSFAEYQRWDLYYVDNWSIWRDLAILAKTVPVVLSSKGAY